MENKSKATTIAAIVSILIVLVFLVAMIITALPAMPAEATSGSTDVTFQCTVSGGQATWAMPTNTNEWLTITDTAAPSQLPAASGGFAGWYNSTTTYDRWNGYWTAVSFNVTALPADVTVLAAKIRMYVNTKTDTYPSWSQFYAFYTGSPADALSYQASDARKWWYGNQQKRYSEVFDYDDLTAAAWNEIEISNPVTGTFEYITGDADGIIPFYIMTTNHAFKYSPPDSGRAGNSKSIAFDTNLTNKMELVITYVANAAVRTAVHDTNAATTTVTDGTESTDNITWGTPRAAYKDDTGIWLKVNGAGGGFGDGRGANITLQLENISGAVLDSISDSIRVDGNYDYWLAAADLETMASGFIRLHETNFNVYSEWGYLAAAPSSTQRTNDIYSVSTEYPQFPNPFGNYVTDASNYMFIHWKTNIDYATENATQELELRLNGVGGLSGTPIYDRTLKYMQDNYYKCTDANAAGLLHWRYAIFAMNPTAAGYNTYNNMVITLNTPLVAYNKGFVQPAIFNTSDNTTLTNTHTSYWYLANSGEYIVISLDAATYEVNGIMNVNLVVPAATQVPTYLRNVIVSISGTGVAGFPVINGDNSFQLNAPSQTGTYYIQFNFSDDDVDNYEYIFYIPFTVVEAGAGAGGMGSGEPPSVGGWTTWFNQKLQDYDLDNEAGHWLVIAILIVIACIAFYKMQAVLTGLIVLIFAGAFVTGWINPWFVALVAPVVGWLVYSAFKKKATGQGV